MRSQTILQSCKTCGLLYTSILSIRFVTYNIIGHIVVDHEYHTYLIITLKSGIIRQYDICNLPVNLPYPPSLSKPHTPLDQPCIPETHQQSVALFFSTQTRLLPHLQNRAVMKPAGEAHRNLALLSSARCNNHHSPWTVTDITNPTHKPSVLSRV